MTTLLDIASRELVTEVAIFYAPMIKEWVVRCFGICQLGDYVVGVEPTDDGLKEAFGDDVEITRRYEIISKRALELIKPAQFEAVGRALLSALQVRIGSRPVQERESP